MKSHAFITAVLLCSTALARADVEVTMAALRRIGFLPQDKAELHPEEKLDMKKRNPFAERTKAAVAKSTEQVETEESRLRMFFAKLEVTGMLKLGDKRVVTLGRLTLEPGQTLQPVIPSQTQILRVLRVEENMLEIGWVEDAGYDTAAPRKIQKKIDLKPKVVLQLPTDEASGDKSQTYTVDDKGKVLLPPRNVFPNPSAIADNLPPGSDTNPTQALSDEEQAQMRALEAAQNQTAPPAPDRVPDAVPPPAGDPGQPPPSPEDPVQTDPDMANPPKPESVSPAGPPKK
jgi:hypothetical protein